MHAPVFRIHLWGAAAAWISLSLFNSSQVFAKDGKGDLYFYQYDSSVLKLKAKYEWYAIGGGHEELNPVTLDLEKLFKNRLHSFNKDNKQVNSWSGAETQAFVRVSGIKMRVLLRSIGTCVFHRGGTPKDGFIECYGRAASELVQTVEDISNWESLLPKGLQVLPAFAKKVEAKSKSIFFEDTLLNPIHISKIECREIEGTEQGKEFTESALFPYFCTVTVPGDSVPRKKANLSAQSNWHFIF